MICLSITTAHKLNDYEREHTQPEIQPAVIQAEPAARDLFPVRDRGNSNSTSWETTEKIAIAVAIREGSITTSHRFREGNSLHQICGIKSGHAYKRFESVEDGLRACSNLLTRYLSSGRTKDNLELTLSIWKNGNRELVEEDRRSTEKYITDIKYLINGGQH